MLEKLNHEIDYLTECWLNTNDPNYKKRLDQKIKELQNYELQRETRCDVNSHN